MLIDEILQQQLDPILENLEEGRFAQVITEIEHLKEKYYKEKDVTQLAVLDFYLGLCYMQQGMITKALEYFSKLQNLDVLDATWMSQQIDIWLATIYEHLEAYDNSIQQLKKAVTKDPSNYIPYVALSHLYYLNGQIDEGIELLEKVENIAEESNLFYNNFGYLMAEKGKNLDKALDFCLKAVENEPENPNFLDSLGWVYFKRKEYDKARQILKLAFELDDKTPYIQEHLLIVSKAGTKENEK